MDGSNDLPPVSDTPIVIGNLDPFPMPISPFTFGPVPGKESVPAPNLAPATALAGSTSASEVVIPVSLTIMQSPITMTTTIAGPTSTIAGPTSTVAGSTSTVAGPTSTAAGSTSTVAESATTSISTSVASVSPTTSDIQPSSIGGSVDSHVRSRSFLHSGSFPAVVVGGVVTMVIGGYFIRRLISNKCHKKHTWLDLEAQHKGHSSFNPPAGGWKEKDIVAWQQSDGEARVSLPRISPFIRTPAVTPSLMNDHATLGPLRVANMTPSDFSGDESSAIKSSPTRLLPWEISSRNSPYDIESVHAQSASHSSTCSRAPRRIASLPLVTSPESSVDGSIHVPGDQGWTPWATGIASSMLYSVRHPMRSNQARLSPIKIHDSAISPPILLPKSATTVILPSYHSPLPPPSAYIDEDEARSDDTSPLIGKTISPSSSFRPLSLAQRCRALRPMNLFVPGSPSSSPFTDAAATRTAILPSNSSSLSTPTPTPGGAGLTRVGSVDSAKSWRTQGSRHEQPPVRQLTHRSVDPCASSSPSTSVNDLPLALRQPFDDGRKRRGSRKPTMMAVMDSEEEDLTCTSVEAVTPASSRSENDSDSSTELDDGSEATE